MDSWRILTAGRQLSLAHLPCHCPIFIEYLAVFTVGQRGACTSTPQIFQVPGGPVARRPQRPSWTRKWRPYGSWRGHKALAFFFRVAEQIAGRQLHLPLGAPCVRLGNAARKLMRLLSQKANGIHVNLCLRPISALASWRSGSLCLGMKRKRASMSTPPCKSVHPPLILHFSLKALLGLPTPTEMPSINRRPAQEEPPPRTDSRSENVYRLRSATSFGQPKSSTAVPKKTNYIHNVTFDGDFNIKEIPRRPKTVTGDQQFKAAN
ncbi:hypothetical protein QC764_116915 [Podospora pseudoanserina]|uniref:Uncharacterized protein n=1 Tax=Podospora pseudoanserina TaxID=2609844 RepID=A0ABR0IR03_9PEZI|nr:hypothetical protein QC764_116915 [Podospora pseudoanserina]